MKETKFKQTDIGSFPEDWDVRALGEDAITSSGGTPLKSQTRFYGGNIKWFTTSELRDSYMFDSRDHITEEGLKNSAAKIFKAGTLLMAMYGATIGRLGILTSDATTNQACCAIKPTKINAKYLFYWLLFDRKNIVAQGCGAGQPNISHDIIKRLLIPVPFMQEQEQIAESLSEVDKLIESLDKLIEKKRMIKQGTMQQLLTGRRRLPGFTQPWVEKTLGDILDYEQPQKFIVKSTEYVSNGIPVLTAGKSFILGYTTEKFGVYTSLPVIIFDDFTTDCKFVTFPFKAKSSAMKMLKLKSQEYDIRLIFEIIRRIGYVPGDHQRHWIKIFSDFTITIPSTLSEQQAIAKVLTDMDNEIVALTHKRDKYVDIKSGMMQQLLTGKIRLI